MYWNFNEHYHSLHTLFKQTCIDDNLLTKLSNAEVSHFCATTKMTYKKIVFKQVSPNTSLICHWSNKQIGPPRLTPLAEPLLPCQAGRNF